jgi:hypothetical protein
MCFPPRKALCFNKSLLKLPADLQIISRFDTKNFQIIQNMLIQKFSIKRPNFCLEGVLSEMLAIPQVFYFLDSMYFVGSDIEALLNASFLLMQPPHTPQ